MKNIAIFASGSGTNYEAIMEHVESGDIKANVSEPNKGYKSLTIDLDKVFLIYLMKYMANQMLLNYIF